MSNFNNFYNSKVKDLLQNKFNYKNIHQIPKLEKICLSAGLGLNAQNKSFLEKAIEEFRIISGQHPIITKSKTSVSSFKIREGNPIGLFVTLRREKMYNFLEKLIKLVFPRIRDFNGFSIKQFDQFGNYNLGISDQLVFPEIDYNKADQKRGLNITVVTTAKTSNEAFFLLKNFGFPFIEKDFILKSTL